MNLILRLWCKTIFKKKRRANQLTFTDRISYQFAVRITISFYRVLQFLLIWLCDHSIRCGPFIFIYWSHYILYIFSSSSSIHGYSVTEWKTKKTNAIAIHFVFLLKIIIIICNSANTLYWFIAHADKIWIFERMLLKPCIYRFARL